MQPLFEERLAELERLGLRRHLPEPVATPGARLARAGQELVQLSSNNYLDLASHPALIEASVQATRRHGCGATGSRLLSGNLELHGQLEAAVARFKGTQAALVFNNGYAANLGLLSCLAGPGDLWVCDKLNHASLIDGARASEAEARWYRHGDLARARALLLRHREEHPAQARWIATDGVFSMDGDVADLPALLELARETRAGLVLDDAHATGVLGPTGRGTFEHFGIQPDARALGIPGLVVMGTFGKALGSAGAYAATDCSTREWLLNRARPFIFSTALPPGVLAASLAALSLLETEPGLPAQLRSRATHFRNALRRQGLPINPGPTPIVPIAVGDARRAIQLSERLQARGVLALAVRPPTVPQGSSRLRCTVMATHTEAELENAARLIAQELASAPGSLAHEV